MVPAIVYDHVKAPMLVYDHVPPPCHEENTPSLTLVLQYPRQTCLASVAAKQRAFVVLFFKDHLNFSHERVAAKLGLMLGVLILIDMFCSYLVENKMAFSTNQNAKLQLTALLLQLE